MCNLSFLHSETSKWKCSPFRNAMLDDDITSDKRAGYKQIKCCYKNIPRELTSIEMNRALM